MQAVICFFLAITPIKKPIISNKPTQSFYIQSQLVKIIPPSSPDRRFVSNYPLYAFDDNQALHIYR